MIDVNNPARTTMQYSLRRSYFAGLSPGGWYRTTSVCNTRRIYSPPAGPPAHPVAPKGNESVDSLVLLIIHYDRLGVKRANYVTSVRPSPNPLSVRSIILKGGIIFRRIVTST